MKTFTEAKLEAIAILKSEPADNGIHFAWIQTKIRYATEMTEESMLTIRKTKPSGLTDESAMFDVAKMIHTIMKKK